MADIPLQGIRSAELLALPDRAEVINGVLHIMSPNKFAHSFYNGRIFNLLAAYVAANNLGTVATNMAGFIFERNPDGSIKDYKVPDATFLTYDRLPADAELDQMLEIAPNLAIEVLSESEKPQDVKDKTAYYLSHGVQQVWLVDPHTQTITVCTPQKIEGDRLTITDTLTGGDLLAGFRVPVQVIFDRTANTRYTQTLQELMKTNGQ